MQIGFFYSSYPEAVFYRRYPARYHVGQKNSFQISRCLSVSERIYLHCSDLFAFERLRLCYSDPLASEKHHLYDLVCSASERFYLYDFGELASDRFLPRYIHVLLFHLVQMPHNTH